MDFHVFMNLTFLLVPAGGHQDPPQRDDVHVAAVEELRLVDGGVFGLFLLVTHEGDPGDEPRDSVVGFAPLSDVRRFELHNSAMI